MFERREHKLAALGSRTRLAPVMRTKNEAMPNALRKLKDRFAERKWSKYFLYLFGEILLVMIGILLAIKINNWNEDRKLREQEQLFLLWLKNEMEVNLKELETVIVEDTKSKDAAFKLLSIYNSDYTKIKPEILDSLFAQVQWIWPLNYQMSVLNSIKLFGDHQVLQNPQIQLFVNSFEESTKDASEETLLLKNVIVNQYAPRVSKYISMSLRVKYLGYDLGKSKFKSDYNGIFNDRETESTLTYIYMWRLEEIKGLQSIRENLLKNIAIVKKELE